MGSEHDGRQGQQSMLDEPGVAGDRRGSRTQSAMALTVALAPEVSDNRWHDWLAGGRAAGQCEDKRFHHVVALLEGMQNAAEQQRNNGTSPRNSLE